MSFLDNPLIADTTPKRALDGLRAGPYAGLTAEQLAAKSDYTMHVDLKGAESNVPRMRDAGILLAAGTDAVYPGDFQGEGLHRELELLVESGLTPLQAITTATKNAAAIVNASDEWGALEVGKLANLVVVDGNPDQRISDTRRIIFVVKEGTVINRTRHCGWTKAAYRTFRRQGPRWRRCGSARVAHRAGRAGAVRVRRGRRGRHSAARRDAGFRPGRCTVSRCDPTRRSGFAGEGAGAQRPDVHGRQWTAVGVYLADANGSIDTDTAPSLGGSYEGVSPHGLWCSALPVAPEQLGAYVADLPKHPELGTAPALDASALYTVALAASIDGKSVATATATRSYGAGIVAEEVAAPGGVRGLYYPAHAQIPQKVPVVVLAGSGGGLPQTQAALLASHGHPTLAQGLFGYKDLPSTLSRIPLESIRAAARWLEQRTGAHRVAVMGTSRGSEAAGLAASYFPQDFSAAVVLVPSHLSNGAFGPGITDVVPAWTYAGKPVPADRGETDSNNAGDAAHSTQPPGFVGTPYYLKTWSDPSISRTFGIPFERMHGAGVGRAIGGGADEMWPSSSLAPSKYAAASSITADPTRCRCTSIPAPVTSFRESAAAAHCQRTFTIQSPRILRPRAACRMPIAKAPTTRGATSCSFSPRLSPASVGCQ